MVKRRKAHKAMKEEACCSTDSCGCHSFSGKLSAMAFILFLVLVWPTVGNALLSVHWGWYLGITVVLGTLAMAKSCWCRKK